MQKDTIVNLNKSFEEYAYEQDGVSYLLACVLQQFLGYAVWRNFLNAVVKAKVICKTTVYISIFPNSLRVIQYNEWKLPLLQQSHKVLIKKVTDQFSL